jgi:hypothetical protein
VSETGKSLLFLPHMYQLGGADEDSRRLLDLLLKRAGGPAIEEIALAYPSSASGPGLTSRALGADVVLIKTNLSTEANPLLLQRLRAAHAGAGDDDDVDPVWATPAMTRDFLTLLWECSIVNSGGFFLYYRAHDGADLPAYLFEQRDESPFTVVVKFAVEAAGRVTLRPYQNQFVVTGAGAAGATVLAEAPDVVEWDAAVPAGCVALTMQRTNPNAGEAPGDLKAEVQNLFNLVQFRIAQAGAFERSMWALPVGPAEQASGEHAVKALLAAARAPLAAEPGFWNYAQTVAIHGFADSDAQNRYAGVGGAVTFEYQVVDLLGNPLGSATALAPIPLYYEDRLAALADWPGVSATYAVAPSGTGAQLSVAMPFDATTLAAADLATALATYGRIRDQLLRPDVVVELYTTLAPGVAYPLPAAKLGDYAARIHDWLVDPSTPPPEPPPLEVVLDEAALADAPNVFELRVEARIARTRDVDPRGLNPQAGEVLSPIAPELPRLPSARGGDTDEGDYGLLAFARIFEPALGYRFKLAEGGARALATDAPGGSPLWAVRVGGDDGMAVAFTGTRFYYAPAPLSTSLLSGQFVVRDYRPEWNGTTDDFTDVAVRFADVDIDAWARRFLEAIDAFLAPELGVPAAQLAPAHYQDLMRFKADLAQALAEGVQPIYAPDGSSPEPTPTDLREAIDVFRQKLLITLGSAYRVSTIVQAPADVSVPRFDSHDPARYYGKVSIETPPPERGFAAPPPGADDAHVSFSVARLALEPGRRNLTFLFTPAVPTAQKVYPASLRFDVSFLEHDLARDERPDPLPYLSSSWLKFVDPDEHASALRPSAGPFVIPVPLREAPASPRLIDQAAVPTQSTELDEVLKWTYRLRFEHEQVAQDDIWAEVRYNNQIDAPPPVPPPARARPNGEDRPEPADRFEALARFAHEYAAVAAHFPAIRAAVDDPGQRPVALAAIRRFRDLVWGAALKWRLPLARRARVGGLEQIIERYRVTEEDAGRRLIVTRFERERDGGWPEWPAIDGYRRTSGARTTTATTDPPSEDAIYDALALPPPERTLSFGGLHSPTRQNGVSSIYLVRNASLGARATNPAFVYRTPTVGFNNPITPLIDVRTPITLDHLPGDSLPAKLAAFFRALFGVTRLDDANVDDGHRLIKVQTGYRFALVRAPSGETLPTAKQLLLSDDYSFDVSRDADPTRPDSFVSQLAASLADWYERARPGTDAGQLDFDFTLFANFSNTKLPLVHLRRLGLSVRADDAWWTGKTPRRIA